MAAMENETNEEINGFNFVPIRIRRTVDDKFFEEYREESLQTIIYPNDSEIETFESHKCHVAGCSAVLKSQDSYNNHYNLNHKHVCCECHRIYPSAHLLDIHISEWHDTYFQLKSEKENSFRCLVETCRDVFATSKQRHKHVIKAHNFPSDFRFETRPPSNLKKIDKQQGNEVVMKESEEMEVDVQPKTTNSRVPTSICFGKGANRGFNRQRRKNK